ncbi:MAG: DUF362 domain-containing protein [Verrucomicrobia bacterium RIFCSPLOWO2_12_FULL_64_8]|nr:MAG: DUF362 domain-containing protein [Verrucomicrobia bacterium RIFCSPLOWO2_12_FULL_64_8]
MQPQLKLTNTSARRGWWVAALLTAVGGGQAAAADLPPPHKAPPQPVLESMLGAEREEDYVNAVEAILARYEAISGRRLAPGAKGKVGLKVYSDSGPGLATPIPLTRAVIGALERRGFKPDNIFLVGLNALRMRLTGYLPTLSSGESSFANHPIFVLESGKFYDPTWFYDSPLPTRFDPVLNERAALVAANGKTQTTLEEDRKSFLATPLFLDADFWINLPVYTDHPTLGINGALVNATLWNASNTLRFFRSPANAPAAVAEMAAIPELRATWACTLVSLERYQFIGGPYFNSLYTRSEPRLWLSADPVALDALMVERLNQARRETGFQPIGEDELRMLEYAEQLGVGRWRAGQVKWVKVD